MSKKSKAARFMKYKSVIEVLGTDYILSNVQQCDLELYFEKKDFRKAQDVFQRIARWLKMGVINITEREQELFTHERMSEQYFILLYGIEGKQRWETTRTKAKHNLPTSKQYWIKRGYSEQDALHKITEHQVNASAKSAKNRDHRKYSIRCKEYWMEKGHDIDTALELLAKAQTRDLLFYVSKYGIDLGTQKYNTSIKKRKNTWANKTIEELTQHGIKTATHGFNPNGQEMQAINMFVEQNDIDPNACMFGAGIDQFYQCIPDEGCRRYDLAVFEDVNKEKLKMIMEFHGPGHINFSDYSDQMKDSVIEDAKGKKLTHLGTYGHVYRNDYIKKKHILDTFPEVDYYVFWVSDLQNKDMRIKYDM